MICELCNSFMVECYDKKERKYLRCFNCNIVDYEDEKDGSK